MTIVLRKVIPNLDNLEACHDYLRDLGAKHQQHGVRREHLDLMALVYCSAIRGVVATQGKFSIFETSSDHVLGYFSLLEVSTRRSLLKTYLPQVDARDA